MADQEQESGYRVLARKYRPKDFDDLIGQDVMVQTLTNAFKSGRIAQAFMLTGLRGIGKTTTARILARALNYEREDGSVTGPQLDMPEFGKHCQEIIESRHIDVIEMDAASHTGIDDIREITDNSRYRPVSARYKVYIIDEVHMLSKQAFNGLLKTLEEPPSHVKFIFATTEIRKVPTTVLSRCQRFTLARVDGAKITAQLQKICDLEKVAAEQDALTFLARAGEGSVRDSLSLLDQAMALSPEKITSEVVLGMLGLAGRSRVIELFRALVKGSAPEALQHLGSLYQEGTEPSTLMADLAEFCHLVTRVKVTSEAQDPGTLSQGEIDGAKALAEELSLKALSRIWQMLSKGYEEVLNAPKSLAAAEMVLIRLCHAAAMPDPEALMRAVNELQAAQTSGPGGAKPEVPAQASKPSAIHQDWAKDVLADDEPKAEEGGVGPRGAPEPKPSPTDSSKAVPALTSLEALVDLADSKRDLRAKRWLKNDVRLVGIEPGRLTVKLLDQADQNMVNHLSRQLTEWTEQRWVVIISHEEGEASLAEKESAARAERVAEAMHDPGVQALLKVFPEAEMQDVQAAPSDGEDKVSLEGEKSTLAR